MLLSNSCKLLISVAVSSVVLTACGGVAPPAVSQPNVNLAATSEFPFSTAEPAEYQAEIYVTLGDSTQHYRYFKKSDRRRLDHLSNGVLTRTYFLADKFYSIDHARREMTATVRGSGSESDLNVMPYQTPAFRSPIRFRFERAASDGDLVTYNVLTGGESNTRSTVTVDSKTNLIVKQEFTSGVDIYVYELRNVSLSVADEEFTLPQGIKLITAR